MKKLSLHQRIWNAASSQEVENVKGRHAYLHGRADTVGEWCTIWSKTENVSWGHGFGRMRGYDQVWHGGITQYDRFAMENWIETVQVYPELGGKDPRPLMECSVHTLVTDVIEVAADGMSARGSFITPGLISSRLNADKKMYCNILWERYGSDFVFEDGKWVYLHEQVCPDIPGKLDTGNWAHDEYESLCNPDKSVGPSPLGDNPACADPGVHRDYSALNPPQNTVPWPEPYETLDNDNSYTPLTDWHPDAKA